MVDSEAVDIDASAVGRAVKERRLEDGFGNVQHLVHQNMSSVASGCGGHRLCCGHNLTCPRLVGRWWASYYDVQMWEEAGRTKEHV